MGVVLLLGLAGLARIFGGGTDTGCQVGLVIHLRRPGVVVLKNKGFFVDLGGGKVEGLLWLKARRSE